jgi:Ran GTPase-activating protein (RanGAP) involved in mRNA processing and transport
MNWKHYGMGDALASTMADGFPALPDVKHVDLCDNRMSAAGIKNAMAAFSSKKDKLESLTLSENNLTGCVQQLASFLKGAERLLVLRLSRTMLTDADMERLLAPLSQNVTITTLDLSHNRLGSRGGELLGEMLDLNISMREMDIRWNNIRGAGAAAIGEALKMNSTMEVLSASWNGFGNKGAEALAEALSYEKTALRSIDLSSNSIGDEGGVAMKQAMKVNCSLYSLQLNGNLFSSGMKRSMLDLLAGKQDADLPCKDGNSSGSLLENASVIQRQAGGRVAIQMVTKNGLTTGQVDGESTEGYYKLTFSSDGTTNDAKLVQSSVYNIPTSEPLEGIESKLQSPAIAVEEGDDPAPGGKYVLSQKWLKGDLDFGVRAAGLLDTSQDFQTKQRPVCFPTNLPSAEEEVTGATTLGSLVRNLL